jgi:signal transduction histidine kinase/ActR/RegA family two-component response regulator
MRSLFDRIAPHFELDAYLHYVADETGETLRLVAGTGVGQIGASAVTRVDAADDPVARLMIGEGVRAYALCPMFVAGRLTGTISFGSRSKERFDIGEIEFLRTIAHYVTVANERARLIRELRQSDRRKDEFLATLAHELRNPLAPIRNALHIMELTRDDKHAIEQGRRMMERQLGHMVRLIDDLLDVSRISRGKLELRKERLELAAVVNDALETAAPLIEAGGHKLAVTLPREPVLLDGDPVRLVQALSNLLNNAAKYTDRGGSIALRAQRHAGEVAITLTDTGIGIPAESLPRIFDMFAQAKASAGRSHGGLGIGLSLVKSLVEMHGGHVRVHSDGVGKGTEVVVRLPIVDAPLPAPPRERAQVETQTPIACRVLVADDNGDAAESMGALLRLMGNEVRIVRDGAAALEEAEAFRPDVMVVDIGMPLLDGYEVARRVREARWGKRIVLVALTGWGQEDDKRRAIEAGFDRHFTKPVNPRKIHALFDSLRDFAVQPRRNDGAGASRFL